MAEDNEKVGIFVSAAGTDTPPQMGNEESSAAPKGKPWMYKTYKLGPITIPCYASPEFQLAFVSVVCFLCPGMFNAINGLGAGGQVDAYDINNANTALYATFAGVGFFAGSIANRIGLRMTLGIGGFGYFLYVASILSYNHNQNAGFLIFAGALLGLCAGLLWTAQGAIMMSYPPEKSKGKYISWFWMIFNLGAVLGSLVSSLRSGTNPVLISADPTWSESQLRREPSQRWHLYRFHGSDGIWLRLGQLPV